MPTQHSFIAKIEKKIDNKTAVIQKETQIKHPKYHKIITRHKKYLIHIPENIEIQTGSTVKVTSSKPISKTKKLIIESVISS